MSYESAMELFGHKARVEQRQARRMVRNEEASKIMKVYLSQYKAKLTDTLSKIIDELHTGAAKQFARFEFKAPEKPSAARLLDDLIDHGYLGGYEYILSVGWEAFETYNKSLDNDDPRDDQKVWDEIIDAIDKFRKVIKEAEKKLNAVAPIFDVYDEPIDDSYQICINLRKNAADFFLKQFKGFDSFMAVESALTEDAKDGAAILVSLGIGAGLTFGFAHSKKYVRAALCFAGAGLATAYFTDSIIKRHQQLHDWNNPTPEEQESIEVFKKKYEPAMMAEAESLRRLMMEEFGSVTGENGIHMQAAAPTMLFTKHVYSHFFVASAKLPAVDKRANYKVADDWQKKLDAFTANLNKKYGGILGCSYIVTGKKEIVFGITFEWVGRDGIILPNLR